MSRVEGNFFPNFKPPITTKSFTNNYRPNADDSR